MRVDAGRRTPAAWVAAHGLPIGGALLDARGPPQSPARYTALLLAPTETIAWRLGDPGCPFQALDAMQRRAGPAWTSDLPDPAVVALLGYDLGRAIERLPSAARVEGHLPDFWAARYEAAWIYDRALERGWIVGAHAAAITALASRLASLPSKGPAATPTGAGVPEMGAPRYHAAVARILEHIRAGDCYQINFALRFTAPITPGDPTDLFARLHERSPVPYAACVRIDPAHAVLSISPERFLAWDADGRVETRPIKGTRPRGADEEADSALATALLDSPKDAAEHVMIVDLERNDLGRVCRPGSVRVRRLMGLESYSTVHHLVSVVEGELEAPNGLPELLRATFPGGSITGAPKVRAMALIDTLEPVRRGIYCGAVGYLSAGGGGDLNIAIRTAWTAGGRIFYSAGGGIVADSDPGAEWDEAWTKASAFLDAIS